MYKQSIGNVDVTVTTFTQLSEELRARIQRGERSRLFFLNAHCYNIAQKNASYRDCLNAAEIVLNDGVGVDIAARMFDFSFLENMNGTDLTPKILAWANEQGFRVFLLGAQAGVAEAAAAKLLARMPKLRIVGIEDGYFQDSDGMVDRINASGADILIVAMGVPLQEQWISQHWEKLSAQLVMGVGAYLDFESNRVSRAPLILRKLKAEWLYRLLIEPKRMWRRYLVGNCLFFYYLWRNGRRRQTHVGKQDT